MYIFCITWLNILCGANHYVQVFQAHWPSSASLVFGTRCTGMFEIHSAQTTHIWETPTLWILMRASRQKKDVQMPKSCILFTALHVFCSSSSFSSCCSSSSIISSWKVIILSIEVLWILGVARATPLTGSVFSVCRKRSYTNTWPNSHAQLTLLHSLKDVHVSSSLFQRWLYTGHKTGNTLPVHFKCLLILTTIVNKN